MAFLLSPSSYRFLLLLLSPRLLFPSASLSRLRKTDTSPNTFLFSSVRFFLEEEKRYALGRYRFRQYTSKIDAHHSKPGQSHTPQDEGVMDKSLSLFLVFRTSGLGRGRVLHYKAG